MNRYNKKLVINVIYLTVYLVIHICSFTGAYLKAGIRQHCPIVLLGMWLCQHIGCQQHPWVLFHITKWVHNYDLYLSTKTKEIHTQLLLDASFSVNGETSLSLVFNTDSLFIIAPNVHKVTPLWMQENKMQFYRISILQIIQYPRNSTLRRHEKNRSGLLKLTLT